MVKKKIVATCIFIISLIIGIYNYSLAADFPTKVDNNYFDGSSKIYIVKPNGSKIDDRFTGISGDNRPIFYVWKGKSHLDVSSGHYRNFYCLQHRQRVNKNSQIEGKVFARIQFNKDKIIVSKYDVGSNDKFCKRELTYNVKNAYFLSYILTKSGEDVKGQNSGNKNLAQRLIWFKNSELNKFLNDLKSKFNDGITDSAKKWDLIDFSGDGSSGNPSKDAKKELKKYGKEAMAYQTFSTKYDDFLEKNKDKPNKVINGSTSLSKTTFNNDSAIIGTVKLNYVYGGCTDTNVKFGDILQDKITLKLKESGKKISKDKWSITNNKGKDVQIKSGTDFFIKVDKQYLIDNMDEDGNIEFEMEVPYKRIYCTSDLFLCVNGNGKQLTSVLGRARLAGDDLTYETSLKLDIKISLKGRLKIQKKDVKTKEILHNYKVYVQDSNGNYYDKNGKNKGSTATKITIGNDNYITIPLPDGKYTVTEAEAPSGYDLEEQTSAHGAVTKKIKTVQSLKTVTAELLNWNKDPGSPEGNLVIRKTDQDTGKPIEGIIFNVYSSTDPDNKINLNEEGLVTDENGEIKLDIGHFDVKPSESYDAEFTIEEVGSNNLYYAENENEDGHLNKIVKYHHEPELWSYDIYYRVYHYSSGHPDTNPDDDIDDSVPSSSWYDPDWTYSYTGNCHSEEDVPASDYSGWTQYETRNVRKIKDCEISITPDNVEVKDPKAYSIALNKIDNYNNNSLNGAKVIIQYEDDETYLTGRYNDGLAEYSGEPEAITINGSLSIDGVKRGTYHVYEVEAPKGYNIELMDNYDEGASFGNYDGAVDLGTIDVNDDNKHPQMDLENQKYVKIRGKVWEDIKGGKDDSYDYIGFDTPYPDETEVVLLKGGGEVARTSTENGEYEFEEIENEDTNNKILYWELQQYTVKFLYDKSEYVTVPVKLDDPNGSKAIEKNWEDEEWDDRNLGESWATTEINSDILEKNYNSDTYYVENINFGVIEKPNSSYTVEQNLEYVKLVKPDLVDNNKVYSFKYKYGAVAEFDTEPYADTVGLQDSSGSFTQNIYPSDIKYNMTTSDDDKRIKVYAVYKITITNNGPEFTHKDIYEEKGLYLNSLTVRENEDRYVISDDIHEIDDEYAVNDIKRWSEAEDEVNYKIEGSNKKFEEGNNGIELNGTETIYVQFRVKEDALEELVNREEEGENPVFDCTTDVFTNGFHKYQRNDSKWDFGTQAQKEHRTIDDDGSDTGLGLRYKLSSTRKVQGSVFEDTKDESEREDERIGDGIYSEDENNLTDVIVSMHNANDNSFAQLYDTLEQVDEHTWKVKKKNAVQKVNEDGTYEFVGLVPGNYYLKFTYGNGDVSYTDMEGNTISHIDTKIDGETINSNLYKSTILTGPAKGEDDKYSGEYWYIGNIEADRDYKKYSIATDITIGGKNLNEARLKDGNINEILNNKTQHTNDGIIEARSPNMNINFEYLKEDEIEHSEDVAKTENGSVDENGKKYKLLTNCKGMYFGIIERPYIDVELKKNIKNIKLTLQNGTTIINQDPTSQNVSPYITNLDTHQDEDTDKEESGYAKLEMDSQNLFSSAIEITYLVKVTNKSEVDYSTVDYYTKGYIDESKDVKTRAAKIIDYIPKDCNYETNKSKENTDEEHKFELKNLTKADIETLYNSGDGYFTEDAYKEAVKDDYKKLEVTSEKELKTWKLNDSEIDDDNTLEYEITVSKLLNNNEEDLGLTSYTELIAVSNIPKTPQCELTSGSYVIGDEDTHEADDDSATLIITPSTGENRDYTVYIIAGAMLIAAIGIGISIKRHLR